MFTPLFNTINNTRVQNVYVRDLSQTDRLQKCKETCEYIQYKTLRQIEKNPESTVECKKQCEINYPVSLQPPKNQTPPPIVHHHHSSPGPSSSQGQSLTNQTTTTDFQYVPNYGAYLGGIGWNCSETIRGYCPRNLTLEQCVQECQQHDFCEMGVHVEIPDQKTSFCMPLLSKTSNIQYVMGKQPSLHTFPYFTPDLQSTLFYRESNQFKLPNHSYVYYNELIYLEDPMTHRFLTSTLDFSAPSLENACTFRFDDFLIKGLYSYERSILVSYHTFQILIFRERSNQVLCYGKTNFSQPTNTVQFLEFEITPTFDISEREKGSYLFFWGILPREPQKKKMQHHDLVAFVCYNPYVYQPLYLGISPKTRQLIIQSTPHYFRIHLSSFLEDRAQHHHYLTPPMNPIDRLEPFYRKFYEYAQN